MKKFLVLLLALSIISCYSGISFASDDTYKAQVTIGVALTDVDVTLTGTNGSYSQHVDSVQSMGTVQIEGVPSGQYDCIVTGINTNGERVKGKETFFPFYFNSASDGIVNGPYVGNFAKDVEDAVTLSVNIVNSIAAENGSLYSFGNLDGYLMAADGTKYPLSLGANGYFSATVPANHPYTLYVSGWDYKRIDGGTVDESTIHRFSTIEVSFPVEWFANSNTYSWTIPEENVIVESNKDVPDNVSAILKVKDPDTNQFVDGATVKVTTDKGTTITGTTENGAVTLNVPAAEETALYTIKATYDNRTVEKKVKFSTLAQEVILELPSVHSFNAEVNVYGENGEVLSQTVVSNLSKNAATKLISGLNYEGIAECERVEVKAKNSEVTAELVSLDNFPQCKVSNVENIEDGETITINFYYAYTDTDREYQVNVSHIFEDAKGTPIASATETKSYKLKAGETLSELHQCQEGEDWVLKNIEGYEEGRGAWFVALVKVAGGGNVKGSINNTSKLDVIGTMPHDDVTIEFHYVYGDKYVEYLANASDAVGEMYVDWCRVGQVATVKQINNGENDYYSRTGYIFTGWNTAADGSGTAYAAGDTLTVNNNITLYAQWSPVYVPPIGPISPVVPNPDPTPNPDQPLPPDDPLVDPDDPVVDPTDPQPLPDDDPLVVDPADKDTTDPSQPKTGDETQLMLYAFVALGAAGTLAFAVRRRKTAK